MGDLGGGSDSHKLGNHNIMNWSSESLKSPHLTLPRYGLLGLVGALGAIYLALVWRSGDNAHLTMSLLFGMAAANLLGEKRRGLQLGSSWGAMAIGVLGLGAGALAFWIAERNAVYLAASPGLRIMPLLWVLGLCLLASGFRLKQYWQELTIFAALGVPSILAGFLPDISPFTAKASALLLWYCGFDVSLNGVNVNLPTGGVQIYSGCSGIESTTYLLGLSVVCLLSFPISGTKRFFIPILAALMGFFINLMRVALMVLLAASKNKSAFDFWHTGEGSLIFGAAAILVFGLFYFFLIQQEDAHRKSSV
jgi:cyanoexosortase A